MSSAIIGEAVDNLESHGIPQSPQHPLPVRAQGTVSRDEMNLAEFPLTVLSKRCDPSVKTLEFSDSIRGKNGDSVNRHWIITGADKFGLPTSSDDEVLLGLLKLTADDGIRNRKVYFTRYELLRILRWTTEGRSYHRLQNALDRLSGVRIKATNAFYDNEMKLHSTRNFGIIDAYEINDGRNTRHSFFTWSEVLFKSFQVGFIKKLDLNFYLDLESAVSKRLYRYLDKHFWYKSKVQINLFTLAHEKVGISRNYAYASSLKQQLDPALDELISRGMLSSYEYTGRGKSTEVVMIASSQPKKVLSDAVKGDRFVSQSSKAPDLVQLLIDRGISEAQSYKLINSQDGEMLEKIRDIINYFDFLCSSNSKLVSRNPQGFLYRAVERPDQFVLPSEKRKSPQQSLNFIQNQQESKNEQLRNLQDQYEKYRETELKRLENKIEDSKLESIKREAIIGLNKMRGVLSDKVFNEMLERNIEEKILSEVGFPEFERWKKSL